MLGSHDMKRILDDIGYGLVIVLVVLAVIFLLAPLGMAALMSFDSRTFLGPFPPPDLSFGWYGKFFSNEFYVRGLKTSLILAFTAASISTVSGVAAAVVLDRYRFPGRDVLLAFFLSPLMVPGVVIGFALLLFFALIGVFDGFARLLGGHIIVTLPYTIRATLAGLVGIKRSLSEAALSLGANERQAFWDITFPLGKTGMVAGAIFAFAISMDDVAASIFLTDPTSLTLPVAMVSMMRTTFDLSIAAGAVMLIALTILLIVLLDRMVGLRRVVGQGMYRSEKRDSE
jgi:putative spermidine/putrescine transport system permease protein